MLNRLVARFAVETAMATGVAETETAVVAVATVAAIAAVAAPNPKLTLAVTSSCSSGTLSCAASKVNQHTYLHIYIHI